VSDYVILSFRFLISSLPSLIFFNHSGKSACFDFSLLRVKDETDVLATLAKILVSDPSTGGHDLHMFFEVVKN
jgi:hypothetical protein